MLPTPTPQLDCPTAPTAREWVAGARPVAGAAVACALLIVVCGWFATGETVFGSTQNVGTPAPVHIRGSQPARDVNVRQRATVTPTRSAPQAPAVKVARSVVHSTPTRQVRTDTRAATAPATEAAQPAPNAAPPKAGEGASPPAPLQSADPVIPSVPEPEAPTVQLPATPALPIATPPLPVPEVSLPAAPSLLP